VRLHVLIQVFVVFRAFLQHFHRLLIHFFVYLLSIAHLLFSLLVITRQFSLPKAFFKRVFAFLLFFILGAFEERCDMFSLWFPSFFFTRVHFDLLEGVVRIAIFLAFLSDCIIYQGAFLALLLIYKLVVDAVIKISVIVLLVDSVFLTTLSAEFDHAAWHYKVGDILWPVIGRVVFLDFLDLVSLINENALDTVEWS